MATKRASQAFQTRPRTLDIADSRGGSARTLRISGRKPEPHCHISAQAVPGPGNAPLGRIGTRFGGNGGRGLQARG